METFKLISMTDFVLEQAKSLLHRTDVAFNCIQYAKFLKQPLTLGMFTACDENGNVLEEPEMYGWLQNVGGINSHATEKDNIDCEIYHKAKERVFFKGFTPCKVNNSQVTYTQKSGVTFNMLIDGTIEDIIWLSRETFELTDSAIKQIGL